MKPTIKIAYPIYWLDDTTVRIGAQEGATKELHDPTGGLKHLLAHLTGEYNYDEVVRRVAQATELSPAEVRKGLSRLDAAGLLEDLEPYDTLPLRYHASQALFAASAPTADHPAGKAQASLQRTSWTLLGLGGGGSACLPQILALGPATLKIVDYDRIDETNLNRQFLYPEESLGALKSETAEEFAQRENSGVAVHSANMKITTITEARSLLLGSDVAICAIDEPPFVIHRIINSAALELGIPVVYMLSQHTKGRVFSVTPDSGCIDCLHIHYDTVSPNFRRQFTALQAAQREGVTAAIAPHILRLTSFAVDEALRIVSHYAPPLSVATQLELDYISGNAYPLTSWEKSPECPTCGPSPTGTHDDLFSLPDPELDMPNNLETQLESLYSKSLAAIDRFASDPSQDTSTDEVNFRLRNFFGLYELVRMTVAPNGSTKHSPTRLSFWVAHRHRAFIASILGRAVGMDPRLSPLQRLTAISQPSYDSPMRLISGRYAELRSRALAEAVESKGGGAWLLGSLKDPQARIEAFDSLTLSGHEPLIELQQARLREQVSSAQNAGDDTTNRQPRCHSALNHKSEVNKLLYSSYPQDSRAAAHAFDTLRSGLGMHFIPSPRADADALALRMLAQHQRNYSGSDAKDLLSSFESILQVALDACAGTVASMEFDGRFARARVTSPTYGFSGEIYLIQSPHAHTPRTFEVRPPWRSPGVAAICIPSTVGETRELSGLLFHELGHAIDHISRTGDSPLDCGLDPESDLIEVPPKLFEALHQESAGPFHPNPGENSEIEDLISTIDRIGEMRSLASSGGYLKQGATGVPFKVFLRNTAPGRETVQSPRRRQPWQEFARFNHTVPDSMPTPWPNGMCLYNFVMHQILPMDRSMTGFTGASAPAIWIARDLICASFSKASMGLSRAGRQLDAGCVGLTTAERQRMGSHSACSVPHELAAGGRLHQTRPFSGSKVPRVQADAWTGRPESSSRCRQNLVSLPAAPSRVTRAKE